MRLCRSQSVLLQLPVLPHPVNMWPIAVTGSEAVCIVGAWSEVPSDRLPEHAADLDPLEGSLVLAPRSLLTATTCPVQLELQAAGIIGRLLACAVTAEQVECGLLLVKRTIINRHDVARSKVVLQGLGDEEDELELRQLLDTNIWDLQHAVEVQAAVFLDWVLLRLRTVDSKTISMLSSNLVSSTAASAFSV